MTVSRKPLRPAMGQGGGTPPAPPRVDVDAIINRGGSVAREAAAKSAPVRARKSVLMNLPVETLDAIASAIASRPVKIPRQTWIEEAIQEKLGREQGKSPSLPPLQGPGTGTESPGYPQDPVDKKSYPR